MRIIIFIFLLNGLTLFAQEKANLCFQKETIDLGAIDKEETPIVNVNFIFYNKGRAPLVIHRVKASCGCTVPNWSKKPIKNGDKGLVKVRFAPGDNKGHFVKTLFVESNSDKVIILLKLKGVVK